MTTPADDYKSAEAAARVDQRGPLPARVDTLAYIPAERRDQYDRGMDGAFHLGYVHADDETNKTAHVDAIAGGRLDVLPPGETRASMAAADAREAASQAAVMAELGRLEANEQQKRRDAMRAEQTRVASRHSAELAALEKRYSKGFTAPR